MAQANALRTVEQTVEPLTTEAVAERIQVYVDRGEYPLIAAEMVARDLCREGRQDELLVLFYPPPLFEMWQATKPDRTDRPLQAPRRRTTRNVLRSSRALLESMVEVDGTWKRLGDLTRADCLRVAGAQKRKALAVAQRARFYHAVATRLEGEQTVRSAFDDEALARVFEEAGR